MKLKPGGRTALWIGVGGFIGLAIGGFVTNPDRALALSPLWFILLAIFLGVVLGVARERGAAPARMVPVAPAASPRVDALAVRIEFPDVPAQYPAVMGRGEPLAVKVTTRSGATPAEGAAILLRATMGAETLEGDGVTGNQGAVEFTLEPQGTGELRLHADARLGPRAGAADTIVTIVEYDHEIERLFGEFRAYAIEVLGPDAQADTARELADKLRARAHPDTARALLELARVYELVAYGEREADRRLYLSVMEQLVLLENADLPHATPVPREA